MPKMLIINAMAELCEGRLAGTKGKIVAYDSVENQVTLEIDPEIYIVCKSEDVEQITYRKPVRIPPKEKRPKALFEQIFSPQEE